MRTDKLLNRLEEIGDSLRASGNARALIALGSVGIETGRLDEYSDLDFFAIVKPGTKQLFLNDLKWLSACCPLAYYFYNTADGCKALYEDGIFCEFAVFEEHELAAAVYSEGRVVWKENDVAESIAIPVVKQPARENRTVEWLLGEALTNLYVGLCRFKRGEVLSATRFIQNYAVDRILELTTQGENPAADDADIFSVERRFEKRYPRAAGFLPAFMGGYERCPESALAILEYLEKHFSVNTAMAKAIRGLLNQRL